jgi:hypothetical protein
VPPGCLVVVDHGGVEVTPLPAASGGGRIEETA